MKKLTEAEAENIRRNPPLNMNIAEAAAYLCISVRKLWTEAQVARRVRTVRFGKKLVFRRAELDRWMDLLEAQSV